jgi:glutathione S-transferase
MTAVLTMQPRQRGASSLRGWLLCRLSGIEFTERVVAADEPGVGDDPPPGEAAPAVPSLEHEGVVVRDTLAMAEYLQEVRPESALLPDGSAERARCRSVAGESQGGFADLRAALPMDVTARHRGFRVWAGAQDDIDRVVAIWRDHLSGDGPFLFGEKPNLADAMFAPDCSRMVTYGVSLPSDCRSYVDSVMSLPEMVEWMSAAAAEPDVVEDLDAEF